jgi:hypothetical protein
MVWAGELNASEPSSRCRKVTFIVPKSRGSTAPRDKVQKQPDYWLYGARHRDGKNPVTGSVMEQENQGCNAKRKCGEPVLETQKIAKCSTGTDEVVVANIPKRAGVMTLRAKDFT